MTTKNSPLVGAQELAAALNEVRMFVALLAQDGTIAWANRVAQALGGCTLAELVGLPLPDAAWWASNAAVREALPGALACAVAGEEARLELEIGRPDERPRWYDLTLRRLPGEPGTILAKGIDISESKRREARREREEATYRAVVDAQTDIISRVAVDGTLEFVNDAYCRFFGRTRGALVGRTWHSLVHPADIEEIERDLARMTPAEPVIVIENRVRDAEGRFRWVEFVNRGFYDAEGRLVEVQSIGRDITLRKEGEVERARAERRMQERQRLEGLGLLAGGVAHDFNNVLTCVTACVELARQELASPEQVASLLDEIEAAAGRAAQLCRQMLAYAGKSPLALGRIDLDRLVTTSQQLLRASLPCGAGLRLRLASGLPEVVGDETQLRQILLNLVVNAGEALGERGGEVTISTAAPGSYAACSRASDSTSTCLTPRSWCSRSATTEWGWRPRSRRGSSSRSSPPRRRDAGSGWPRRSACCARTGPRSTSTARPAGARCSRWCSRWLATTSPGRPSPSGRGPSRAGSAGKGWSC